MPASASSRRTACRTSCLGTALILLSACSSTGASTNADDPAEPVNRGVFAANQFLDRNLVAPVARAYRDSLPQVVRSSVGNFAGNLREPMTLANDLLQGNTTRAWNTTQRFVVNSTVGVAGLMDVASDLDLPRHSADFGQTLGVWGVGPGPAVQLPLLGPSNARDTIGTVVGFVANPLSFIPGGAIAVIGQVGTGARLIDGRAELLDTTDQLERTSLDYYATLRSANAQRRAALVEEGIRGGTGASVTVIPGGAETPARPATP
ncbi:MlaA family lipoprotein [Roseomonas sp. WA12]